MNSWPRMPLSELITPRKSKDIPSTFPDMPYIGMENVAREIGRIDAFGKCSEYKSSAPRVFKGDVLYGRLRPYLNKVVISPCEAFASGEFIVMPENERITSKFLQLRLLSQDFVEFAGTLDTGDRPRVSWEQISKFQVDLPPIDEQRKIVELLEDHLSRLDAALADVKQAKVKASQFRRSLLQVGLNGFFNNGARDKVSGLPNAWTIETLDNVADWTSGGTPSSKDSTLYGGNIPWIVIGDLNEGEVFETEKTITQKGLDSSSAKKLPVGTVMVAMYGASIGRTGVMGKEMTTNQAIVCGIPKGEKIFGQYLLYFLQSQKNEFIAAGKGGAQPNISQGVVKSWKIPLPPKDEQLQIINEIDSQLEHLAQANNATVILLKESTGLRRSLLQAAFTGQLVKEKIYV